MSEIKGQLLGIILVLAIFGVIGAALYTAFKDAGTKVAGKVNVESIETQITTPQTQNHALLTFQE